MELFWDIELLQSNGLDPFEIFYYASLIHLVLVKIHPFQDGNGRIPVNRKIVFNRKNRTKAFLFNWKKIIT